MISPYITERYMTQWQTPASQQDVQKTIEALQAHNITTYSVATPEEAKQKVLTLLPKNSEVMDMTSITLQEAGITKLIQESGEYISVKKQLSQMDRSTQHREMVKLGTSPEWAVGSAQAVTWDGKIVFASATGSQIPAYVYGAEHVILVIGTQKIVPTLEVAFKRIEEYILPLESDRLRQVYNNKEISSSVNKVLILHKEVNPQRITIIFINQSIGF